MHLKHLLLYPTALLCSTLIAQRDSTTTEEVLFEEIQLTQAQEDSLEASYVFRTGAIEIANGAATLNIPAAFKFLDAAQSKQAIVEVWENPPSVAEDVLGIIFRAEDGVLYHDFFFVVEYEEEGYVSDADADSIDYDAMLVRMLRENGPSNRQRKAEGYTALDLIGWASPPYYDKDRKVLHWAKEMRSEGEEEHVLNYNIRVLGRKGVLVLNAVSTMNELEDVSTTIPAVLDMARFNDGFRYDQFDASTDKVADRTVGGLVDGRLKEKIGAVIGVLRNIALGFLGLLIVITIVIILVVRSNKRKRRAASGG